MGRPILAQQCGGRPFLKKIKIIKPNYRKEEKNEN